MLRIVLQEAENRCLGGDLAASWAGFGGEGASDGGSVGVDFGEDALYPDYTP